MPNLQARLVSRRTAPWGRGAANPLRARIKTFVEEERKARQVAAEVATKVSRSSFTYRRPAIGAQRAGRESTGGRLASFVEWSGANPDRVTLNTGQLDAQAPHWIIQEIGTGQRASMRVGGQTQPRGRPRKGATHVRTVPSQRGRRISGALVFAEGLGGQYTPPGAARGQQLYLRSQVTGAPRRNDRQRSAGIIIRREIEGQHFVQKGAQAGFRQYRGSVLAAARQAFRKRGAS